MNNPYRTYAPFVLCLLTLISTLAYGQSPASSRILTNAEAQAITPQYAPAYPLNDVTAPTNLSSQTHGSVPTGTVTSSAVTAVKIAEASNVYTSLHENSNQLYSYTGAGTMGGSIAFIHRQNIMDCGGVTTDNGRYRYSISTSGGNTWDIGSLTVPPTPPVGTCYGNGVINPTYTRPTRYPGVALFSRSHAASTDSLAIVYSGPTLQAGGNGWDGWVAGTVINPAGAFQVTQEDYYFQGGNQYFANSMVHQIHPVSGDQNFWFVSQSFDASGPTNLSLFLNKGTYNPATRTVNWTIAHTFTPPYYLGFDGTAMVASIQMAFSPDGQHGWIGMLSDLIGGQDSVYSPVFFNSTNGGDTWSVGEEVFLGQFPDLIDSLQALLAVNVMGDTVPLSTGIPACGFDCDLEVDSAGNPHMLVVVSTGATINSPEPNYGLFSGAALDIYDITKDPYGDWNMLFVSNQDAFRGEFGNVGSGTAEEFTLDVYGQVSRSSDGTKIFFTWTDSDTTGTLTNQNNAPDLIGRGYNVGTNLLTPKVNWTYNDLDWATKAVLPKTANAAFQSGNTYRVPTVITNLDNPNNALAPVSMWYFQDVTYDLVDFTETARFFYNCKENPFTNNTTSTPASCGSNNNGTLTLTPGGGIGPYTYQWDANAGNATTATVSSLNAGIYTVTVTDSKGCIDVVQATVNNTGAPTLSIDPTSVNDPQCAGVPTGTATGLVSGGTGSLFYLWSNGETTPNATALAGGTSSLTVTDSLGCSAFVTITLTYPPAIMVTSASTQVLCAGDSTGTASVTASGGAGGPFTYLWSSGESTASIVNKPLGTYMCTVTDASGCSVVEPVTISQPANALSTITGFTNVSSCTSFDGTASVTASGGTPPYRYLWTLNGTIIDSISFIFGLTGGLYIVQVTDAAGCTTTDSAFISGGSSLVATPNTTPATCSNSMNGSVTLSISGSSGNPTFAWSNGATTQNLSGVNPGNYSVIITEPTGCVTMLNVTVPGPPALVPNTTISPNTTCIAPFNGAITLNPTGGASPYTYSWSNGGSGNSQTGLASGSYTVTINDNANCTYPLTYMVPDQPDAPVANITRQNVACNGDSTGSVSLAVTGGSGSYTYNWSHGPTTQNIAMLAPGTYSCVIFDPTTQCSTTVSSMVSEPPAIVVSAISTDVLCNGESSGTVNLSATGGSGGFIYSWSNGATTQNLSMVPVGFYTCVVTDINGCVDSTLAIINEPPMIMTSVSSTPDTSMNGNGTATASAQGGRPPFQYSWNTTPAQTGMAATGLIGGLVYTVTITDANNCVVTDTITVGTFVSLDPTASILSWETLPNPSSGILHLTVQLRQTEPATFEVYDLTGRRVFQKNWKARQHITDRLDLTALSGGIYLLRMSTPNGLMSRKWVIEK